MAFAAPTKNKLSATNLAKSSWTPMNNSEANVQVFDERKELINKWFEKWNEKQRKIIVKEVLKNLSEKHLMEVTETLKLKFPQEKFDFTRRLPRVLSLYVFSFLDPRSLCRCAQVSWYWKYLTEMDCVWRPKCLKFGWYPTYQPSEYEESVWKRFYVSTIYQLHYAQPKADTKNEPENDDGLIPNSARSVKSRLSSARSHTSSTSGIKRGPQIASTKKPLPRPKWEPPPWKGSDRKPTDTVRYNYLDNQKDDASHKKKVRRSFEGKENHQNATRRPRSASGSIMSSPRNLDATSTTVQEHQPKKSTNTPYIKGSLNPNKNPTSQSMTSVSSQRKVPVISERNMLSSSVAEFAASDKTQALNGSMYAIPTSTYSPQSLYKHNYPLFRSVNNRTLDRGYDMTLNSSTYHVDIGTINANALNNPLNGNQSLQRTLTPDLSNLSLKDAGIRPKPVIKSPEKPSTGTVDQSILKTKINEENKNIRNIAMSTDYQVKNMNEFKNGKITPLQGSPWKHPENLSDDD